MPRDAFALKIQIEICHPKCARRVSGLSRNGPQGVFPQVPWERDWHQTIILTIPQSGKIIVLHSYSFSFFLSFQQLLASPDLMDELYSRINNFRAHFNPMSYQQDSRVTGRIFMNNRWSHRNSEKREPVTQDYDIRRAYLARNREERFRVPQELKEAASVNSDNRLPLEISSDYL